MTTEINKEDTFSQPIFITNDNFEEYKDKLSSQTEKLIVESINLSEKSFKITNCEIKRGELTKCEISLINDSELTNIKFNDCKDLKINKSKFTDSEFIDSQISEFKDVNFLNSKLINCQKFNKVYPGVKCGWEALCNSTATYTYLGQTFLAPVINKTSYFANGKTSTMVSFYDTFVNDTVVVGGAVLSEYTKKIYIDIIYFVVKLKN